MIAVSKLVTTGANRLSVDFGGGFDRPIVKALLKRALVMSALLAMFSGCATTPEQSTEERVGQRALEWAETLMAMDYDGALTYMTPSYQASPRADRYRGDFAGAGFWRSVIVHSVDCGNETPATRCKVRLIIGMIRPPELTREMPIPYDTTWVFIDGTWYQYRK